MKKLIAFFILLSLNFTASAQNEINKKEVFDSIVAVYKPNSHFTTSDLLLKIGLGFLNKPYVASTLEINNNEKLVVNLNEFDCTTFAENCLALAQTIKSEKNNFQSFEKNLTNIRYRHGALIDYNSRLHYFSDWIFDNDMRKNVKNITCEIVATPFNNYVDFMSTHVSDYKILKENPDFLPHTQQIEKAISARKSCYIPKADITKYESKIQDGDIIGITTNIKGMDIAHVVLAYHYNGELHILHASSKLKKVVISTETLSEYINNRTDATGIMVARPI